MITAARFARLFHRRRNRRGRARIEITYRRRRPARARHPATATDCPDCDRTTTAAYIIRGRDGIVRCWDCATTAHAHDQPPGRAGDYPGTRIAVITGHE